MSSYKKVAGAALIGNTVEWYDFYIFGMCSALIFPKVFFPDVNPAIAFIVAMSSYAVGFIARPIGALLFGHFGDILGRRKVLMASLLLMGTTTFSIGLLPSYATWGITSVILLCALRFFQGLAVGGEWGSAVVMAIEHAPKNKRCLFGSFVQIGVPLGLLLATSTFQLMFYILPENEVMEWGWRIPFLASFIMVFIGAYIRLSIEETPEFEEVKKRGKLPRLPIVDVITKDWKMVLRIGMYRVFQNTLFNMLSIFYIAYATSKLGMEKWVGLAGLMIATFNGLWNIPLWASVADKYGTRTVSLAFTLISIGLIFPTIWAIKTATVVGLMLAIIVAFYFEDAVYGLQGSYIPDQFETARRLTASNISYNIGGAVAGLLLPVLSYILAYEDNLYHVGIFVSILGIISALCILPETVKNVKKVPLFVK
mgnify:CR=1 FL=1